MFASLLLPGVFAITYCLFPPLVHYHFLPITVPISLSLITHSHPYSAINDYLITALHTYHFLAHSRP